MFLRMQQKSSDFFRLIHTDEERRLIIVFWVHPQNRAAYEEFNDVVTVDFSYIVNRYKMPFVSIVGVNHHGQSILFGLALISREDKETYKQFFNPWVAAMVDQPPTAIMTNQCESMRNAMKQVMQVLYVGIALGIYCEKFLKSFRV